MKYQHLETSKAPRCLHK